MSRPSCDRPDETTTPPPPEGHRTAGPPAARVLEVFTRTGLDAEEVSVLLRSLICAVCSVEVWDVRSAEGRRRARSLGVRSFPAVALDGRLVPLASRRS